MTDEREETGDIKERKNGPLQGGCCYSDILQLRGFFYSRYAITAKRLCVQF